MNGSVVYFAYGSNLLFARLHARVPSIVHLGTAVLPDHRISFNKPGGDGSGKCGIEKVANREHVYGVLYQMDARQKPDLDVIEGVGHGYVDQPIQVHVRGKLQEAYTYYPSRLDCEMPPFDWYKSLVLSGARENGFPDSYIELIDSIPARVDPDENRRAQNLELSQKVIRISMR